MAQVQFLKAIPDSAGWKKMDSTDDITLNSYTGNGSALTNLNMSNASSGILDKAFYDSSMAGSAIHFLGGVLSVPLLAAEGLGVNGTGMFVDYDGTTIGISGTKLAVVGDFTTNAFTTFNFITEDDVVASSHNDIVNFVAGTGIAFTTVASSNTITFTSTASGGGGVYTASNGVAESPANNFILDTSNFNNWGNTQRFSGFTGLKLDLQGVAGDGILPIVRIQDSASAVTLTIDQDGKINCGEFVAAGDTILGTNTGNVIELNGLLTTNILPDASNTRNLGGASNRWEDLFVDDLIGNSKTVSVDNLVDKTSAESISGTWSFTGHLNIGDVSSDTLTITSVIDSNFLPDASNSRNLGGSSNRWEDIFVDDIVDTNGSVVPTTRLQLIPDSGTSKPSASSSVRGHVYVTEGGAGVADVAEVCLKSATDTYSWVNLATG